ncbi:hypothetical protein [Yersinia aldovae]|uniref:hypothetical protein n=1 Tax=Yersinia aldovae TaxID=29483 RepID=UPI00119FDDDF|nr:hypothetical protein [Yersinia aldovae]
MTELITIKIPRETVTVKEFAAFEGMSIHTVYKWTADGRLDIAPKVINKDKKRPGGKTKILYAMYKAKQAAMSLGHSRFKIIISA